MQQTKNTPVFCIRVMSKNGFEYLKKKVPQYVLVDNFGSLNIIKKYSKIITPVLFIFGSYQMFELVYL